MAQSARSCDFGHLGEHVGNGLVVVDDRPCEERRSAPIGDGGKGLWGSGGGFVRSRKLGFFGLRFLAGKTEAGTMGFGGQQGGSSAVQERRVYGGVVQGGGGCF